LSLQATALFSRRYYERDETPQAAMKVRWTSDQQPIDLIGGVPLLGPALLRQPGGCVPPGGKKVQTQIHADKKG
jgi:hypothetical protein